MTNKCCIIHCFYMYHENIEIVKTWNHVTTRALETCGKKKEGSNPDGILQNIVIKKTKRNTFWPANNSGARRGGTNLHRLSRRQSLHGRKDHGALSSCYIAFLFYLAYFYQTNLI